MNWPAMTTGLQLIISVPEPPGRRPRPPWDTPRDSRIQHWVDGYGLCSQGGASRERDLSRGPLTGSPPQAWMPEKHLCAAPYLTKTRGAGRLLWWPPREPAHLGCSAANGHLGCQAGLSVALQSAVTSLQDALQHTVQLRLVSLGTTIEREGWGLLCPHSQDATRETCHPQISCVTWTLRMSCRRGSGRLWGTGKTFCDAPGAGRKQSWRHQGKPRAACSRR